MIILLGSQKGGCGKSTIAINIAAYLSQQGKDVVLLDADLQASASRWVGDRPDDLPVIHCLQKTGDIKQTLKDLNNRYGYVIVDTAGHDSKELRSAMLIADILIVPFRPSQFDLDTLEYLSTVIDNAQDFNEKLKPYGLLTLAPTHAQATEAKQSKEYIAEYPILNPLSTIIHDRKIYRDSVSEGKGVVEADNVKAKDEFIQLMNELGV